MTKYWFYWIPEGDDDYYFSCGKGWYKIIFNALDKFLELYPQPEESEKWLNFRVQQIKEKYGGLRIYTSISTPEIEKIIRDAEDEAWKTCEYCGSVTDVKTLEINGWISTLCESCRNKK